MKTTTRAAIALAAGASLALAPALAASAASSSIVNGSFETDPIDSTTITGWTSMNQAIDLGITSIAGCVTVDTSDYLNLRDYADDAGTVWNYTYANVPNESSSWYYVHEAFSEEPVVVLGSRLVYDDDMGEYYLEIDAGPVSAPAFALSSVTTPDEQPAPPAETAPEQSAPEETAPDGTAPDGTAPEGSAPEGSTPEESAPPAEPTPEETAPEAPAEDPATEQAPAPRLSPANGGPSYLPRSSWSAEQEEAFLLAENTPADPALRADNLAFVQFDEEEYSTTVVDGADVGRTGKVLSLYSDMYSTEDSVGAYGYVVHGPAVYSEPFTVPAGRQITLDWKAVDESDDFHVFGYLLNVDTCAQTEVIDATGESQEWTTTSVAIPSAGTYRFVFVSGSYDKSWGGAAGAYMYIDNIAQTPAFSSPGIELALAAGVGDYLPGSDVQVSGGGLLPNSPYSLVLRSTPVLVTEGVTDDTGRFIDIVPLPMDITPGAHTITLTGHGPSGPLTQVAYITVGADGTLLYFSLTGPQDELAFTGAAENAGLLAFAALLTLTGAAAIELERRRRSPFSTVYVR